MLTVEVRGLHQVWAFKCRLRVPLAHVRGATADPGIVHESKGLRGPGLHVPGGAVVGTFHHGQKHFWDVRSGAKAVVIELTGETYDRLIVDVTDPRAAVEAINAAMPRSGAPGPLGRTAAAGTLPVAHPDAMEGRSRDGRRRRGRLEGRHAGRHPPATARRPARVPTDVAGGRVRQPVRPARLLRGGAPARCAAPIMIVSGRGQDGVGAGRSGRSSGRPAGGRVWSVGCWRCCTSPSTASSGGCWWRCCTCRARPPSPRSWSVDRSAPVCACPVVEGGPSLRSSGCPGW